MSEQTRTCFVIMPIATREPALYGDDLNHFRHVYEELFEPAIREAGYEPEDPQARKGEFIHARIIRRLRDADLVLSDLSGLNPNVLFELGVRTALNRPVAIVGDETVDFARLFDVGVLQQHQYQSDLRSFVLRDEIPKLADFIRAVGEESDGKNPMWSQLGIEARAELDTSGNVDTAILARLEQMTGQLADLTRNTSLHSSGIAPILAREGFWDGELAQRVFRNVMNHISAANSALLPMGHNFSARSRDYHLQLHYDRSLDASELTAISNALLLVPAGLTDAPLRIDVIPADRVPIRVYGGPDPR